MPIVRFLGKILPTVVTANFHNVDNISWGNSDLGFPFLMSSRIRNSNVEVICDLPQFKDEYVSILLGRALNLVHACIDMCAFATGVGLMVRIETIVKPDGNVESIIHNEQTLGTLCSAYSIPADTPEKLAELHKVLLLIIHEPELMGSLMDLAETLVSYHTTPTNCGRALDTLRRAVAPKLPCKQGWATLRGIVNADKEYMEWVSAYSTNPRHGERRTDIPANIIVEIRKRTWNVMNRMMEYRKGGSKPLDMVKYPMLVHDPSFPLPRS